MKKSILVILAATLTFALAGCGGGGSTATTTSTPLVTTTGNGTSTTPAGTDISGTPITATLKSATFANNSSAVTAGVYHLSNPGPIKINYELASYVDKSYGAVTVRVRLSNLSSDKITWQGFDYDHSSQDLGDVWFSGGGAKNIVGSYITLNSSSQYIIESPAYRSAEQYPYPFEASLDFTKPFYILVTAYTQDTNIAYTLATGSVYISSQIAIPITILP